MQPTTPDQSAATPPASRPDDAPAAESERSAAVLFVESPYRTQLAPITFGTPPNERKSWSWMITHTATRFTVAYCHNRNIARRVTRGLNNAQ